MILQKSYKVSEFRKVLWENPDYSFKSFFKRNWWLLSILVFILILSLVFFGLIIINDFNNVGAWASMIAGVLTYLGATVFSMFLYYKSWQTQRIEENRRKLKLDVMFTQACNDENITESNETETRFLIGESIFKYKESYNYEIRYKNYSKTDIKDVDNLAMYLFNGNHYEEIETDRTDTGDPAFPMQFKEALILCYKIKTSRLREILKSGTNPILYCFDIITDDFLCEYVRVNIFQFIDFCSEKEMSLTGGEFSSSQFNKYFGEIGSKEFWHAINKEYEIDRD